MSRCYNTTEDFGLSRQSSKSYKVVCQKSNAELSETLRRLDIEHHSNIAKILNERYTLRTVHHELRRSGESESSSDSDCSDEPEPKLVCKKYSALSDHRGSGEKTKQTMFSEYGKNSKQQNVCQLPCIIEEAWPVTNKPKSTKFSHRSSLPPLGEQGCATRAVRRPSEGGNLGNPTTTRSRERSATLPTGHLPGDKQRKSEFRRVAMPDKVPESNGRQVSSDTSSRNRSSEGMQKGRGVEWEDIKKCRYLRRRRHSSHDVFKSGRQ